jgi:hypothetical protein
VPETPDPQPSAIIGQILTFAGKLAEALDDAEFFGGLAGLRGEMKFSTAVRMADELKLLRAELDAQLEALDRGLIKPGRKTPLRRQLNKAGPDPDRSVDTPECEP